MRFLGLLLLCLLPLLAAAQDSASSQSSATARPTATTVFTTTIRSEFVTTLSNSQVSTGTSTIVVTSTEILGGNQPSSDINSSRPTSTSTTPKNLPTAPSDVSGGGSPKGAPVPGQAGVGGAYGPDDEYIAAAFSLSKSPWFVSAAAAAVGAAVLLM